MENLQVPIVPRSHTKTDYNFPSLVLELSLAVALLAFSCFVIYLLEFDKCCEIKDVPFKPRLAPEYFEEDHLLPILTTVTVPDNFTLSKSYVPKKF